MGHPLKKCDFPINERLKMLKYITNWKTPTLINLINIIFLNAISLNKITLLNYNKNRNIRFSDQQMIENFQKYTKNWGNSPHSGP